jgi:hypothetical protein
VPAKKKPRHATERASPRVQPERRKSGDTLAAIAVERLKCVDEAGVNLALPRRYGRAPAGERAVGSVPCNSGPNVTRRGALGTTGRAALMTSDGATDGPVLQACVEQVLCPTLQAGDVVVMENVRVHKVAGIEVFWSSKNGHRVKPPSPTSHNHWD